ncbi:MAG: amidohydrolase family protein [Acidobacteriota bacterium]
MTLMVAAGLTSAQVLTATTVGSASLLEEGERLGQLQPGYRADLLLLAGNPLEDIQHTRSLRHVVIGGVVHER